MSSDDQHIAYLSLGSNLGDRYATMLKAIDSLVKGLAIFDRKT